MMKNNIFVHLIKRVYLLISRIGTQMMIDCRPSREDLLGEWLWVKCDEHVPCWKERQTQKCIITHVKWAGRKKRIYRRNFHFALIMMNSNMACFYCLVSLPAPARLHSAARCVMIGAIIERSCWFWKHNKHNDGGVVVVPLKWVSTSAGTHSINCISYLDSFLSHYNKCGEKELLLHLINVRWNAEEKWEFSLPVAETIRRGERVIFFAPSFDFDAERILIWEQIWGRFVGHVKNFSCFNFDGLKWFKRFTRKSWTWSWGK